MSDGAPVVSSAAGKAVVVWMLGVDVAAVVDGVLVVGGCPASPASATCAFQRAMWLVVDGVWARCAFLCHQYTTTPAVMAAKQIGAKKQITVTWGVICGMGGCACLLRISTLISVSR